ncbi:MAG TPA: hypothetical protein VG871_19795, partial [Vicinamibacterales bacterium]|nr:hypothetical protein [Vicinamibacterales bacterium]
AEGRRAEEAVVSNGYLALQVVPVTAEVFIDGLYVGTVNDVRGDARGEALAPGAHRLELRAPGYQPVALDLRVAPGRTTVYRGDLALLPPSPAPAVPAAGAAAHPKAFYVIPGCYAGDSRPDAARLPRGCNLSNLRTIPAVLARVEPSARP